CRGARPKVESSRGNQDLWCCPLARGPRLVDGKGARARLRAHKGGFRDRRDAPPRTLSTQSQWACPGHRRRRLHPVESMAINLYLVKKYGRDGFYPTRLADEARAWQWSFWGMTEVERPVLTALFNRTILPENQRDAAAADAAEKTL